MLLQEFHLEITNGKGTENQVANHLSRLDGMVEKMTEIKDFFVDEQLLRVENASWYVNYANYLVVGITPPNTSSHHN